MLIATDFDGFVLSAHLLVALPSSLARIYFDDEIQQLPESALDGRSKCSSNSSPDVVVVDPRLEMELGRGLESMSK